MELDPAEAPAGTTVPAYASASFLADTPLTPGAAPASSPLPFAKAGAALLEPSPIHTHPASLQATEQMGGALRAVYSPTRVWTGEAFLVGKQ